MAYRTCGTHARVSSLTLPHGYSKFEIKERNGGRMRAEKNGNGKLCGHETKKS